MEKEKGMKFDGSKLRMDLIPVSTMEGLAEILTFGAQKYAPNNWKVVADAEDRYYSALLRHLIAYKRGEENDPESGFSHLKHALTNIAFLLEFEQMKKQKDAGNG